jgi:hypothetical protein
MKSPATLSCFVASWGCALSCSSSLATSTQQHDLTPPPVSRAAEADAVPAPAHAPATPSGALTEPPLELAPEERDVEALLANVCQLAYVASATPGLSHVGCACCPPFEECEPGKPAIRRSESAYFPGDVVSGAFTRAGADQRAVPIAGCESHAENYGGMLVLDRGASGLVVERYISVLAPGRCWTARRDDGRDLLVCERGNMHQGHAQQLFFQWDLAQSDEDLNGAEPLLDVADDAWSGCYGDVGRSIESAEASVPRFRTRFGRPELEIALDIREGKVTQAYLDRCRALESLAESGSPADPARAPRALLRQRSAQVTFRFDGARFVRAPSQPR